ncbi:NAD(P)-binding protein [Xylaria arbuscula]|nr:NAD(P)-binding protein [Xylaria arbuscula]
MTTKTVLITGCSSGGLGGSLALAFSDAGYTVYATARNPAKIDESLTKRPRVRALALDVTNAEQIAEVATQVASETAGRLDILINNAGGNYTMPVLDASIEESKKLFDTNFWGVVRLTQAFSPLLVTARGTVVNISSIAGVLNTPFMGMYGASKAAVTMISETLRLEMQPFHVKVITVMAGNVETQFWVDGSNFALPSDSLYTPIVTVITDAAAGTLSGRKSTPDSFSRDLLNIVTSGTAGIVWKGALAGSVKWVVKFMPTALVDKIISNSRGLDKLAMSRGQKEVNGS